MLSVETVVQCIEHRLTHTGVLYPVAREIFKMFENKWRDGRGRDKREVKGKEGRKERREKIVDADEESMLKDMERQTGQK